MNDIQDVIQAIIINIGFYVGTFLLNTGRALKAIEIYKECLIILNNEILKKEDHFVNVVTISIYQVMFEAYCCVCDYTNAIKYGKEVLDTYRECGDTAVEGVIAITLANIYVMRYEYVEARKLYEKAINITEKTGDRKWQAYAYRQWGTMYLRLGEYVNAKKNIEKYLAISIEIGDRQGEVSSYGDLGTVFKFLGEYDKAKEYLEKAITVGIEIGYRDKESADYANLGTVFHSLGEYDKAKEHYEKALALIGKSGDKYRKAAIYGNLGTVSQSLGEYDKAKEYLEKALAIKMEIDDASGGGTIYGNLGRLFACLGEYNKAKECYKKALTITRKTGDRHAEASTYRNLGILFHSLGEHVMAEGYLEKALSISQDIGSANEEFEIYCSFTMVKLSQAKPQEAFYYLILSLIKSEDLRGLLRKNDQFKVAFADEYVFPYRELSALVCSSSNSNDALYVLELARARALADLMATQYSVERKISGNPQSWIGIENIMKKEINCACLYISYFRQDVFLWILKTNGVIHFRRITVNENITGAERVSSLHDFMFKSFRSSGFLSQQYCEDRSLDGIESKQEFSQEEVLTDLRLGGDLDDDDKQDPEPSLPLLYKMIIAPVADLLEESEIIIVPDSSLYQVPFAALTDEGGKYLSETFRIRIVPSLTTLKLIQDSPADYHSQTGALIVGDPVVGRVRYMGCRKTFLPLPFARKEAEMIGELLGEQPLLGQCATKQAVLERLNSVSLIHFAAHGNAERGEIALSPLPSTKKIPREEDYLLTMSDISQVRLRAKLVVLSCCHSERGQIRAEGVVGIARAFLGSGARSVLVALWALDDLATEKFMRRFYKHLVRGESATESLHETMKWMRDNGFIKVSEWAPFMLIGDNVTFDIEKLK